MRKPENCGFVNVPTEIWHMNTPTQFRLNIPRAMSLPGLQVIISGAGVRDLTHVADCKRHPLVELELVHSLVVSHVQERLPVHFQDLIADLKQRSTKATRVSLQTASLNLDMHDK